MTPRAIGYRLFADGLTRPVYEDERGQLVLEDGEPIDGVWLVPEEKGADTPRILWHPGGTLPGEWHPECRAAHQLRLNGRAISLVRGSAWPAVAAQVAPATARRPT